MLDGCGQLWSHREMNTNSEISRVVQTGKIEGRPPSTHHFPPWKERKPKHINKWSSSYLESVYFIYIQDVGQKQCWWLWALRSPTLETATLS